MGMMTIAVRGPKQAAPHEVRTHRVYNLRVDIDGNLRADVAGRSGVTITIQPDRFMGIVDTFDWGGPPEED